MNSSGFAKGDILEATDRRRDNEFHKIIYYEGNSDKDFIGGMIIHSRDKLNAKMIDQYFQKMDANEKQYKVVFDDTYLVIGKFIKPEEWGAIHKSWVLN